MASKSPSARAAALIVISCLSATAPIAQTAIKLTKNGYTTEQDVQIGRQAAHSPIAFRLPAPPFVTVAERLNVPATFAGR
jgi:hypothetical protein